jgi:hypothetical protein
MYVAPLPYDDDDNDDDDNVLNDLIVVKCIVT